MDETQQREPTRYREDRFEDEIELIDYLRVVWKRKYLILLGTLMCAVAAVMISFTAPKIYRLDIMLEPGILRVNMRGNIDYIDSPSNIKALIEAGTFSKEILSNIGEPNNNSAQSLDLKVNVPKKGNVVKVSYETSDVERGSRILNQLGELLWKKYAERVAYFQNEYEREIDLKQNELAQIGVERKASEWQIRNLQKRIDELRSQIEAIRENMGSIIQKREKFLSKNTNKGDTTSAVLYMTVMQQVMALENSYSLEINDFVTSQEQEKGRIEEISIRERMLLEKIEELKSKKTNIQNIQILQPPTSSPYPIKPKTKLNVMLATVVGLFVTLFLAFFLEYLQRHRGESGP